MEAAPSPIPDFYVPRPEGWSPVDAEAFEWVNVDQVVQGPAAREINYRLDIPKWKFLCWLAQTKDVLLHGSNVETLRTLEPRRPRDPSEFGGRKAVFSSSDAIWAMFFAVLNRSVATSMMNGCFSTNRDGEDCYYYFFSVDSGALEKGAWRDGTMYILPRATFERESPVEGADPNSEHQWASPEPVSPLASLRVQPQDFPLLANVRGHDVDEVSARAARDPDAFPWLREGR